jgi:hypothetical protein
MLSGVKLSTLAEKQPTLIEHHTVNPLVIDLATVDLQPRPNTPVAVSASKVSKAFPFQCTH